MDGDQKLVGRDRMTEVAGCVRHGIFRGVGVGPGDPELITVKACKVILLSPVIAYPELNGLASFARRIVAEYVHRKHVEIVVQVPLRSEKEIESAYEMAAQNISCALRAGQDVAFLCEGDPLVYGTYIRLFEKLNTHFVCEIIPGISSILAVPARLGRPLVSGDMALSVIPATLPDEALQRFFNRGASLAFVKVGRHAGRLKSLLDAHGLLGRAYYIERATLENERQMRFEEFNLDEAPYFSFVVVDNRTENAGYTGRTLETS